MSRSDILPPAVLLGLVLIGAVGEAFRRARRRRPAKGVEVVFQPLDRWLVIGPPAEHQCLKPLLGVNEMSSYPIGSVWRCRCGRRWRIDQWSTPGGSQDFVPEWTEMSVR